MLQITRITSRVRNHAAMLRTEPENGSCRAESNIWTFNGKERLLARGWIHRMALGVENAIFSQLNLAHITPTLALVGSRTAPRRSCPNESV